MIPIRDTIPSRNRPVMSWLLIITNLLIFLYLQQLSLPAQLNLIREFALIPANCSSSCFMDLKSILPLVTYQFLHAGWMHLIGNCWALWLFGDNIEDRMGPLRFFGFYITGGIIAGLVHIISNPGGISPTIGASGSIAGLMGAYFLMFPGSRIITLVPFFFLPLFIEIPAVIYLLFWLLAQVYSFLTQRGAGIASNIAWAAHIGGFIAGIIIHRFFFKPYQERYHF